MREQRQSAAASTGVAAAGPAPTTRKRHWCATGSASALAALAPLVEAHASLGPVGVVAAGAALPDDAGTVLRVGGEAPRAVHTPAADGGRVTVGWLPEADTDALARFAVGAARVVERAASACAPGPIALLAQWDDRALALADELEARLGPAALRWTAERVARRDLVDGLGCGVAAALYVGHALSWGWVGYGGVTAIDLASGVLEPLGCVLSIACDTALATAGRESFAAALPLAGACAATLGATGKTLHESNRTLALAACAALPSAGSLADLLSAVPDGALEGYVVCGDPGAPIASAADARHRAAGLYAPAPAAPLSLAPGWPGAPSRLDRACPR
jgi:hypothetical protein